MNKRKMSRTDSSMTRSMNKSVCHNDFSIVDAENFEPPQQSSTPAKYSARKSKRILKDNTSLNISVISKQDKKNVEVEIDDQQYKPILPPVVEENVLYDRVPELFCSDPEDNETEEEYTEIENKTVTEINDSDDKWTTFSDISDDKSGTNITDILAEIDADVQMRFEKPPRRSYPGRKRSNKSLFEDEKEEEDVEDVKVTKKDKKSKQKKKIDPQEEAFIQSINEHFNDVETFNLIVE